MDEQLRGLDRAALGQGFKLLAAFHFGDEVREIECVREFQERRVAGIVVFGASAHGSYLETTPRSICPIVVANPFDPACHLSNRAVGRQAFESLFGVET